MPRHKLKIIPLGGLGEIGKNMMAMEYGNDIVVIDAGLMFPSEEMPGVDLLLPDIGYLLERQQNLRGVVITHGHEDHIGALPYLLSRIPLPVYCTRFARELISVELRQRGMKANTEVNVVTPGNRFTLGCFTIEFFPVCHSIPDCAGLIINTPQGIVVHSGDFKVDHTPVVGEPTDFRQLAVLGAKDVLLLLSDSTYVELAGYTPSESVVTDTLDRIISEAKGRVIVTTFASLVSRIQQVLDVAVKRNRRVFITGRSMKEIVNMALKTGYLKAPQRVLCRLEELRELPCERVIILSTGSQGEPTSALVRMANRDPRSQVQILAGDTVVISATAIPGNEGLVSKTTDSLFRQGARVIYDKLSPVHVHGHGSREELKLLISLVRPRFFVPIHGEYRHLCLHADLAETMGIARGNIFVLDNGDVLELGPDSGTVVAKTHAGVVYVDGLTTGMLDDAMIRDRMLLARDGVVVVTIALDAEKDRLIGEPCIRTLGFVDAREEEMLIEQSQEVVLSALDHSRKRLSEPGFIDDRVKDSLGRFFQERVHRRPVVIPVVVEAGKTRSESTR
jgi:ribonuclease J